MLYERVNFRPGILKNCRFTLLKEIIEDDGKDWLVFMESGFRKPLSIVYFNSISMSIGFLDPASSGQLRGCQS